jgi:hypothetical protein
MIQQLEIEPTYRSPEVIFDPKQGDFKISGNSILVNVEEFYGPLFKWMDEFIENPTTNHVKFVFDIAYTNVASTKRFLLFLYKLKSLIDKGIQVEVDWLYAVEDQFVLEIGNDLSQMLNLPFNLVPYKK